MAKQYPLKLGTLFTMTDEDDSYTIDELKQNIETALNHLNDLIADHEARLIAGGL